MRDVDAVISVFLLAPAVGLATDFIMQAMLSRSAFREAAVIVQLISFGSGLLLTAVVLVALLPRLPFAWLDIAAYFILHVLVYVCLGFIFFNIINANISSLRIQILKEHLASNPAPVSAVDLSAKCLSAEILSMRLARLEAGGQILARDDRYYLKGTSVAAIGAFFGGLRRLLLGEKVT